MAEFHPLFPPSDDDDDPDAEPPDIQFIHVQRKEQGKYVTAPQVFMAADLQSVTQVFNEFGGGEYQLVGKDSRHILRRKVIFQLPGPSKPMFDEASVAPPKPAPSPVNPMMAMMGASGEGGIMPLIMMMMQQMMQQQSQASQQSMQMMMAFMQTMASGTAADKQAAQEAMNRQAERDARAAELQMNMMKEMMALRQPGNSTGGEESFFKGVEFMRHFSTQQIEMAKASVSGKSGGDFDLESILESIGQAMQGFSALKEISGSGGIPTPEVGPS